MWENCKSTELEFFKFIPNDLKRLIKYLKFQGMPNKSVADALLSKKLFFKGTFALKANVAWNAPKIVDDDISY